MSQMSQMSEAQKLSLKNALIGCAIADAVGAGTEMKSRQWLLKPENFRELLTKYWGRDPKFSAGFAPGNYTDDFEMTLAVLFALFQNEGKLTTNDLYEAFKFLYFETVTKNNVERAGYGSISKLLKTWKDKGYDAFKTDLVESMLTVKVNEKGDDAPGNATLMRVSPIVFFSNQVSNAIENALSTKPHAYTVFTSVYLVLAGKLLNEGVDPEEIISRTTFEFQKHVPEILKHVQKKRESILSELPEEKRDNVEFLDPEKLVERFLELIQKLDIIDDMDEPENPDEVYTVDNIENTFDFVRNKVGLQGYDPIDGINYHELMYPYATPLKGECGLGAKASQTLFCAMFCLKWNRQTSLKGNLMRIQMFGGDTDTLGACVLPYIYEWHCQNGRNNLPQWIYQGLEMYGPTQKYGYDDQVFNTLVTLEKTQNVSFWSRLTSGQVPYILAACLGVIGVIVLYNHNQ